MSEDKQDYKVSLKTLFDLTDLFYFAGLGASTYGVYDLAGAGWACVWCGVWLIATAYKAY